MVALALLRLGDHLHRDLEAIVKRGGAVVLKVILYLFFATYPMGSHNVS